jgi:uncharacterized protein (TIGR03083 family)
MNELWAVVHKECDALVHDLLALEKQQWTTPSLCPGWDIHAILPHLVSDAETTRIGFVSRLIAAGFKFDRINASGIARERSIDRNQTLAYFQGVRSRTACAPAPPATRLVEVFVHGEDIQRPLSIDHEYPVAEVTTALHYQTRTSVKLGGGKERLDGLRLIARDVDFDEGIGKEVRGTAIAPLLAVSGRPVHTGELTGLGALSLTGTN